MQNTSHRLPEYFDRLRPLHEKGAFERFSRCSDQSCRDAGQPQFMGFRFIRQDALSISLGLQGSSQFSAVDPCASC